MMLESGWCQTLFTVGTKHTTLAGGDKRHDFLILLQKAYGLQRWSLESQPHVLASSLNSIKSTLPLTSALGANNQAKRGHC